MVFMDFKMTIDTQHLEFMISQYVDGGLDAGGRRYIEQQIATDSAAGQLHKDHRDVQDVLEDWGSRLAMIDWAAFDAQLAIRLEKALPAVGTKTSAAGHRWKWLKPVAIAAGIALAAAVGYRWHGGSVDTKPMARLATTNSRANTDARVRVDNPLRHPMASTSVARVDENIEAAERDGGAANVAVFGPHAALRGKSTDLADIGGGGRGLSKNSDGFGSHRANTGSVSAMAPEPDLFSPHHPDGNNYPLH